MWLASLLTNTLFSGICLYLKMGELSPFITRMSLQFLAGPSLKKGALFLFVLILNECYKNSFSPLRSLVFFHGGQEWVD